MINDLWPGVPCKVLKLLDNNSALVQPQIEINATFHIANKSWTAEIQ